MALHHDRRQTAHHTKHNVGWRKAVRYALTENPIVAATPQLTSAEYRRRARLPQRAPALQGGLFEGLHDQAEPYDAGQGIWDET